MSRKNLLLYLILERDSGFRGSKVQRFKGSEVQRFRGSKVPRFRGSEVQRLRGIGIGHRAWSIG
jgi:hypothetical protein